MRTTRQPKNGSAAMTKISANFFTPMWLDFDHQVSRALLRRDAFLDRMIAGEVPHLREDLKGKSQSKKARKHVSDCLKSLGGRSAPPSTQVSISVKKVTADALTIACADHNISRDTFLNRLIVLLRASDHILQILDLPKRVTSNRRDGSEDMATSPLKAIEEIQSDPLHYLRSACQERHGCGLYNLPFPKSLDALACHLGDDDVPGTPEFDVKAMKEKEFAASLGFLNDFETTIVRATKGKGV